MTTSITRYGYYIFLVVPFGLTNALGTFMCLMNSVFNKYLDKFVLVFLNGIHLLMALKVIKEHNIYENLIKCEFY